MYTNIPRVDAPLLYSPPQNAQTAPIKLDCIPCHPSWQAKQEVAQDKDM